MRVPTPGAHGGDGARLAAALGVPPAAVLDLSASLNPFAPDPAPVVARHLDSLGRYPDARPGEQALASLLGVPPERVVLTNGGAGAIALVAAVVGGGVVAEPDFALHPRAPTGPRWRSDPHNPSGRLAPADERLEVRDEAFYALATGRWTRGDAGSWVVGSLTKTFACPGLRLGYVVVPDGADPEPLRRRQGPWPVSGPAVGALVDLLGLAALPSWAAALAEARDALVDTLAAHGLAATAADAPWVLVEAAGLRARLAPRGVAVRDCTSFGLPGVARVAVPGPRDLPRLDAALAATAAPAGGEGAGA